MRNLNMNLQGGQLVNVIGNYLYRHIDSAFKFEKKPNIYDVYFTVFYEIPEHVRRAYQLSAPEYTKINEMTINLNVTTYQNKIRIDTIEVTPDEMTLGFDLFLPEKLDDLNKAFELVMTKVYKRIAKRFEDFDFVF